MGGFSGAAGSAGGGGFLTGSATTAPQQTIIFVEVAKMD